MMATNEWEVPVAADNAEIAEMFREMADLLEIENANPFRIRAYRNAAFTVDELPRSLDEMVTEGEDLTELPGIGEDLANAIIDILASGTFPALEQLRNRSTPALLDLMQVPGLGPKRVQQLHAALGIETVEQLQAAAEAGEIRKLSGFGEKTEQSILDTLGAGRRKKTRRKRAEVQADAEALEAFVQGLDGVLQAQIGGSYRRRRETVADLDVVAASTSAADVIEQFVQYEEIADVQSKGTTRSSVLLRSGLPVDLRVVVPESYGSALHYFTGARDHQIALRDMALDRGMKLNEYGLFRGEEQVAGATEEELYAAFDLPFIEPELRENRGEIDAARRGELPTLITLDDIRGDLHVRSDWAGGESSIEELARAAIERGYEYLAITDNGLDPDRLRQQAEEIRQLDSELDGITLLAGVEVDILEDGSLALPDDLIEDLDIVICSVHDALDLTRAKQTARVLRAIENPNCHILGHPTGRLVAEREPYPLDIERVISAAADTGCILELNGNPDRLDLPDRHCKQARERGASIAVTSAARSVAALDNMRCGIWEARRGWLEAGNVVNTLKLDELRGRLR